jgi:hypothetical protein
MVRSIPREGGFGHLTFDTLSRGEPRPDGDQTPWITAVSERHDPTQGEDVLVDPPAMSRKPPMSATPPMTWVLGCVVAEPPMTTRSPESACLVSGYKCP